MKMPNARAYGRFPFAALWILLVCLGTGCSRDEPPEAADGAESMKPVAVQAAKAELRTLRPALKLMGTTIAIPERIASVSSRLGGWVETLAVVEGQSVHAGDVLIRLDSRAAQTDVARAKAVVAEKQAALSRLKRGYLPQEIEVARQERDKARETMEALETELNALQKLVARQEYSDVQYESKAKMFSAARAAYEAADAQAKLMEQGTRPEMIDEAQAQLDVVKADLEQAELALNWCTVTSPIDGVLVQLLARQGQYLDRASTLATIMDLSEVFVQLRIPSSDFAKVTIGAPVDVDVSVAPAETFRGTVQRISGEADPLTGNVIVFAAVPNERHLLRPGLSCQARVWLPEIRDALVVPVTSVADHSGTPVVTVVRDGKAFEAHVELGAETQDLVQVLKGLSPGDLVATAGGYGLPEGCPVQIVADLASTTSTSQ